MSGASPDSCHGRLLPARCTSSRLTSQVIAISSPSGVTRHTITLAGSCVPAITTAEHRDDRQPFEYQDQRRRAVCLRVATANAERVEDDQYDGLNGYAAEDVADGHADVARQRCASDDRDFGRVGRQREQDQPAQRRSQMQPRREDVGLLGQLGSCDPDRGGGRDEEHEEDWQGQTGHRALTRDGRAARPMRSARGAGNDGTRAPRWSNWERPAATPGRDVPAAKESARVQLGTPGDAPALWSLMRGHLTCVIATLLALLALTRT